MKTKEREKARELRKQGLSVTKIAQEVNATASSVSRWTQDIELTDEQKQVLKDNSAADRLRRAELAKKNKPNRDKDNAKADIAKGEQTWIKGDLGVMRIAFTLAKDADANISMPISGHIAYDLVAEIDNEFYKVQAKSRAKKDGCIYLRLGNTSVHRREFYKYKIDDFDILAIYCQEIDEVYWLGPDDIKAILEKDTEIPTITLRIDFPLDEVVKKNMNMASDYTLERTLRQLGENNVRTI